MPTDIELFAVACTAVKTAMGIYGCLAAAFLSTQLHKLLQILDDEYKPLLLFMKKKIGDLNLPTTILQSHP